MAPVTGNLAGCDVCGKSNRNVIHRSPHLYLYAGRGYPSVSSSAQGNQFSGERLARTVGHSRRKCRELPGGFRSCRTPQGLSRRCECGRLQSGGISDSVSPGHCKDGKDPWVSLGSGKKENDPGMGGGRGRNLMRLYTVLCSASAQLSRWLSRFRCNDLFH